MEVRISRQYKKADGQNFFFISNWIVIVMQDNQRKEFKINSTILYMNPSDVTEVKVPRWCHQGKFSIDQF